jgi:hypothetical protein
LAVISVREDVKRLVFGMRNSVRLIVPVLRSVARKRLVKAVID